MEKHGRKPLGTNGALLYMVSDHVVRPAELPRLQHPNVDYVPYKGLHPLRSSSQSPFNSVSTLRRKLRSLPCSSFSPQNLFCGVPLSLSFPK